jgi:hypothetical protein
METDSSLETEWEAQRGVSWRAVGQTARQWEKLSS